MSHENQSGVAPRRRWGRRIFMLVVLLFVGLITAHAIWSWSAQRDLAKLVAGYRAAGEPTTPAELENVVVPDGENAVIDLRAAMAVLQPRTRAMRAFEKVGLVFPRTTKERAAVEAALQENAAMFPLVQSATAKPRFDWKIRITSPVILVKLPDLASARDLAKILAATALAAHEEGDDAGAVRHVREILFLGRAVVHQPPSLLSYLTGIGIRSIACDCVEQIASDLRITLATTAATRPVPRAELQQLIDELLDETESAANFRRAMLAERMCNIDSVDAIIHRRIVLPTTPWEVGNAAPKGFSPRVYLMTPILLEEGQFFARVGTALSGVTSETNFPAAMARAKPSFEEVDRERTPGSLIYLLTTNSPKLVQRHYHILADARLAALALAVRQYAADHESRVPDSLAALVPAYLSKLPLDPFARDDSVMRYLSQEPDPRIYSVGENGTDDGGSDRAIRSGRKVMLRWESVDAVLHLHRPPRDPMEIGQDMRD